jgi:hypothetical protein
VLPGFSDCYTRFLLKSTMAATAFDLCVLDENILEIDPKLILESKVVMMLFDGNMVFDQL